MSRIATALEKLPQRQAPDTGCEAGQDNRSSDLCAQWKAADGAAASAVWTERAFWAGVVGLLIGGFTLFFASRAAHWAKEAAGETKRSANFAFDSLEHAREISRLQLRAYVDFSDPVVITRVANEREGRLPRTLKFCFKNFGQTPAEKLTYEVFSLFGNDEAQKIETLDDPIFLAPGDYVDIGFDFDMLDRDWPPNSTIDDETTVSVSFRYFDIFGGEHTRSLDMTVEDDLTVGVHRED